MQNYSHAAQVVSVGVAMAVEIAARRAFSLHIFALRVSREVGSGEAQGQRCSGGDVAANSIGKTRKMASEAWVGGIFRRQ
jgi:hypothetical protein